MQKTRSGFTLVELLIVLVVIAILASISLAVFRGLQVRALKTELTSELAQYKKTINLEKAEDGVMYAAALSSLPTENSIMYRYFQRNGGEGFCLDGYVTLNDTIRMHITNISGVTEGLCSENTYTTPGAPVAVTAEACFSTDLNGRRIADYYDHQDNNSANPACPREVNIPTTIRGVTINVVGGSAFQNNQLTSVEIPNNITEISVSAFRDNLLTSITIPNTVTLINTYAFANNQLTSVTIPSSVTSLRDYAFSNNRLSSVTIPSSITSIAGSVFRSNQLTSVTIPNSVTTIGTYAFTSNQLTTINIPQGVTSIGSSAFESNQLTSVTIPNSVTTIGLRAFRYNRLTTLNIPQGVTSIAGSAFRDNQLTSVTFPSSLATIDGDAFLTNNLTAVSIASSTTVATNTFSTGVTITRY